MNANWRNKLIFIMNFGVLDFFKFASRMPQIAQILVLTFNIFRGSMPPDLPKNFLLLFFFFFFSHSRLCWKAMPTPVTFFESPTHICDVELREYSKHLQISVGGCTVKDYGVTCNWRFINQFNGLEDGSVLDFSTLYLPAVGCWHVYDSTMKIVGLHWVSSCSFFDPHK